MGRVLCPAPPLWTQTYDLLGPVKRSIELPDLANEKIQDTQIEKRCASWKSKPKESLHISTCFRASVCLRNPIIEEDTDAAKPHLAVTQTEVSLDPPTPTQSPFK